MNLPSMKSLESDHGKIDPYLNGNPHIFICCNQKMALIYNAQEQIAKGWWCSQCNYFEPAIGRERKLSPQRKEA